MKNKTIKKADVILILAVIVISSVFLLIKSNNSDENLIATISVNGEVVDSIDLSRVTETEIKNYINGEVEIEINKNQILFHSSNCKSQICVNSGILHRSGDTAACLPNKVLVSVNGKNSKNQFQTF